MSRRKMYSQISGWEGVGMIPQEILATVLFFKSLKNWGKKKKKKYTGKSLYIQP